MKAKEILERNGLHTGVVRIVMRLKGESSYKSEFGIVRTKQLMDKNLLDTTIHKCKSADFDLLCELASKGEKYQEIEKTMEHCAKEDISNFDTVFKIKCIMRGEKP